MPATEGGAQTLHDSPHTQLAESNSLEPPKAGSASPSVEELPSEILSSILGRVSAETGGLEAAGVCRRWRGLSENSQRRLSLPTHVSEDALMALLARYPNVRVLSFDAASGRARHGRQQLVSEAEEDSSPAKGGRTQLDTEAHEGSLSGRSRHGRRQPISEAEDDAPESWELEEEGEDSRDESQSPFLATKGQGAPAQQRQGGPLLAWAYRGLSLLGTSRAQRQGQGQGLRPRHGWGVAPVCSASVQPHGTDAPGAPGRQ